MPQRAKAGFLAALLAVAACCAMWGLRPSPSGHAIESATPQEAALPRVPDAAVGGPPQPVPQQAAADLERLRERCGQPWLGTFGTECREALERRYAALPAVVDRFFFEFRRRRFNPVMLGRPVTWGEVFEDPAGTLSRVEAAIARPECLPPERHLRLDLQESCAADDMARLAILRRDCARTLFQLGYTNEKDLGVWGEGSPRAGDNVELRQQSWDLALEMVTGRTDTAEYQALRERMDDEWYGAMWRAGKCAALPRRALAALGPFRAATGWPQAVPDNGLMETAARLGSEAALSAVLNGGTAMPVLPVLERSLAILRTERPALAELLQMWRSTSLFWDPPVPRREFNATLPAHAAAAVAIGEAVGAGVQQAAVWERLRLYAGEGNGDRAIVQADRVAAMPIAARRLIALGWIVVVDAGDDAPRQTFAHVDDVRDGDPWLEWWDAGRVSVRRSPGGDDESA